ncbi:MAG: hypothetical protein ACXWJB_07095 [Limisphaerales bacterium]
MNSQAAITVPGTANPWLAGMPNGSTACGGDTVPSESPVLFNGFSPGDVLTFSVSGSTDHGGSPFGLTPDGGTPQTHAVENGMSSNNVPISSLVGVFLDNSQPSLTVAPDSLLYSPSNGVIRPALKQVFFIGDGLTGTGSGTRQQIVAPVGATRLFLGTQDGCAWADNGGSFSVTITDATTSFAVAGTANPWLAGMPNGSIACGGDIATAQSPVLVQPVIPGTVLTFDVSGTTDHGGPPFGLTPDGGTLQTHTAENGIASNNVPISGLVGVFLDSSVPTSTQAPAAFADVFSAPIIRPNLKQVFFIGDGLTGTGTGTAQQFVVPTGATRLFLGTQDGCTWADNGGSFQVTVSPNQDINPIPSIRASQVEVCFDTLTNRSYQVQYSTALNTNWTNLGAPTTGTGTPNCIQDAVVIGLPQKFYRVISAP